MAQTLGIVDAVWRGKRLVVEKGSKVKLGGLKANRVKMARRVDYAEEFEESEVTVTTRLARGERLSDLFGTRTGPLQIICDTGQTFSWDEAVLENRPEATGGEGGKVEMKWFANEAEEVLSD